jgi:hypothetical protein
MFEQFIGTKPVEERHRLDVPRLEAYLRERIEGFAGRSRSNNSRAASRIRRTG